MINKNNINEDQLNELFRNIYLNDKSTAIDEDAAQFVLDQEYNVKPDAAKEKRLIEKLSGKPGGFGNSFFFTLLSFIFIGVSLIFFFLPSTEAKNKTTADKLSVFQKQSTPAENNFQLTTRKDTIAFIKKYRKKFEAEDITTKPLINFFNEVNDSLSLQIENPIAKLSNNDNEPFVTVLTADDKARCNKIKNAMLQKLIKADKDFYTHIEADKMNYRNNKIIVDAFTIRNFSVSNLEYKTFLTDLLIQNKKSDYLKAAVLSENWNKYDCKSLSFSYFTDEKYNDFPVVNVTEDGAKLFCKWLEEETQLYITQNKLKTKTLKLRLPYDTEWIYAAWMGYTKISAENNYNTIFDAEEGLVDKSFFKRMEQIKKKAKRNDTLYDYLAVNMYGWEEKNIIKTFNSSFSTYSATPPDTLYSDRMKYFGRKARISQMAIEKQRASTDNSEKMWFIGLGWKNKDEYLKLQNDFQTNKASPFIGFRFVIINDQDSDYKNPFW